MSTNPIIIEIVDKIDSSIAGKLQAIGAAARQSANDLNSLQLAINGVSGGTTNLSSALNLVQTPINNVTASVGNLERGIGNLLSRVVGMELGLGRLGGAFGSIGMAAAGAGPLILAALAVGAVIGAILVYDKLYAAQRKLVEAQTELADHFATQRDKLMSLQEAYAGIVDGPMAKYQLAMENFSKRSVSIDIAQITKVLDDQKSKWADMVSLVERYGGAVLNAMNSFKNVSQFGNPISAGDYSITGAEKFITDQKLAIATANEAGKGYQALKQSIVDVGTELVKWHEQEKNESGTTLAITEVGRKGLQSYYLELKNDLAISNQELKKLRAEADGETLADMKRAAAKQMIEFNEELQQAKESGLATAKQQELAIRQAQQTGQQRPSFTGPIQVPLELNQRPLEKDISTLTGEINKQAGALDSIIQRYKASVDATGAYSEAMKIAAEMEKLLAEAERRGIDIKDAQLQQRLKDVVTSGEKQREDNKANQILRDYNIGLTDQIALSGKYGQALIVETQIMSLRKTLQKDNRDLDEQQQAQLRQTLTSLEQQKIVQRDLTALWDANAGAIQKSAAQITAVNKAYADGVITLDQWKIAALNAALAQNQLNNAVSGGTLQSNIKQVWGGLIADFNSLQNLGHQVTQNLDKDFTQFFSTLEKGIGNGIAQWAVYGKSLSQALLDTARQAVAGLISSLIDLALQYVIVIALQKAFNIQLPTKENDTTKVTLLNTAVALASIAAVTVAELTAINILSGPAWALAEAVSILSFGAADAAAVAGMAAVVSAGSAASVPKLAAGGLVMGPGGVDKVPAWLTRGEFVVNAAATEQNRSLLESINSGATATRTNSAPVSVGGTQMQISIVHDGATSIGVQQIDEKTVRIIAKQEARAGVSLYAPGVISSDLQNPNSKTSKAINVNLVSPRRR